MSASVSSLSRPLEFAPNHIDFTRPVQPAASGGHTRRGGGGGGGGGTQPLVLAALVWPQLAPQSRKFVTLSLRMAQWLAHSPCAAS